MKKLKYTLLLLLSLTALNAQSQALRLVGYAGEVVLTNGDSFPVSGSTLEACQADFNATADREMAATGASLYEGRSGTQRCTASFVYRSPTAPGTSLSPAATLLPELPVPPLCLSCLVFEYPGLIKDLFPVHNQLVQEYVQLYKIDQYNQDLIALQNQYKQNLAGFEKKMFALEEELADQDK